MVRPVALVALLLAWLPPAAAEAVTCAWPPPEHALLPADDATDVPANTLLWSITRDIRVDCPTPPPVRLVQIVDAVEVDVPMTWAGRICAGFQGVAAWRPQQPLEEGLYIATSTPEDDWGMEEEVRAVFRVGAETDQDAPAVPVLERREVHTAPPRLYNPCNWEAGDYASYSFAPTGALGLAAGGHASWDHTPAPETIWADLAAVSTDGELTVEGWMQPTTRVEVRLGAVDLAGNFSGWSEPDTATMPAAGCSTERTWDQAALLLLLLGVRPLHLTYRRRRSCPSARGSDPYT